MDEDPVEEELCRPLAIWRAVVVGIGGMVPHQRAEKAHRDTSESLITARSGSQIEHIVVGRLHGVGHAGIRHAAEDIAGSRYAVDDSLSMVVGIKVERPAKRHVGCHTLPGARCLTVPEGRLR